MNKITFYKFPKLTCRSLVMNTFSQKYSCICDLIEFQPKIFIIIFFKINNVIEFFRFIPDCSIVLKFDETFYSFIVNQIIPIQILDFIIILSIFYPYIFIVLLIQLVWINSHSTCSLKMLKLLKFFFFIYFFYKKEFQLD